MTEPLYSIVSIARIPQGQYWGKEPRESETRAFYDELAGQGCKVDVYKTAVPTKDFVGMNQIVKGYMVLVQAPTGITTQDDLDSIIRKAAERANIPEEVNFKFSDATKLF